MWHMLEIIYLFIYNCGL